jgi:hypothetical protein
VPFAEHEHILSRSGRIAHVDIDERPGMDESAVEQRYQGDGGGKGSARMQPFIRGIAALLQRQDADVRILDLKQLRNPAPQLRSATHYLEISVSF